MPPRRRVAGEWRPLQNGLLRARTAAPKGDLWNMANHSSMLPQFTGASVRLKKSRTDFFNGLNGLPAVSGLG